MRSRRWYAGDGEKREGVAAKDDHIARVLAGQTLEEVCSGPCYMTASEDVASNQGTEQRMRERVRREGKGLTVSQT